MAKRPTSQTVCGWAALVSAGLSLVYVAGQLLEWAGLLGSDGGPESSSTPLGIVVLLTPSLLLAPAFVVMMAGLHQLAPESRKALSLAGLSFAIIYATLVSLVYFVQLTLVGPRMAAGDMAGIEVLRFVPYRSFLFAVDLLAYSFMSLATLAGAFATPDLRHGRLAACLMLANGLLVPFLALQMFFPVLIWGGALWGITFPAACLAIAAMAFRGAKEEAGGSAPHFSVM